MADRPSSPPPPSPKPPAPSEVKPMPLTVFIPENVQKGSNGPRHGR